MPGTRRLVTRTQTTPPPLGSVNKARNDGSNGSLDDRDGTLLPTDPVQPKHAHIPEIPLDSNMVFEGIVFVFSIMCLGLQYINLYKTVWWLPQSHANYALNFYMMDPYLFSLLIIIMSRRVAWCFLREVFGGKSSRSCLFWLVWLIKFCVFTSLMSALAFAGYHVVLQYSLLYSLFICYPLLTYIFLFGVNIRPLFGKMLLCNAIPSERNTPKHKIKDSTSLPVYCHNCTMSPEEVRDEADILKTDFNHRVKQVLFNSMVCAYYMGFVPLCFAQNTLYYDTWWVGQHVVLVWISAFVLFMVHFLPAKYVDVLHRCALHLGKWVKVEGRNAHVPYTAWSELQVWPQGALVKHVRGLFKAEGINNAAEPGNNMHARFYFMFHSPLRIVNWLLIITWGLVGYQFILLIQATDWSHILSLAFLLFSNFYVLFKLMRDRFILNKAYKDELLTTQGS